MLKKPSDDDVLKRTLKTPPKPFTPKAKPKPNPGAPATATKAERAAQKRVDKMVVKRMRKR